MFATQVTVNILPPIHKDGPGVYAHTGVVLGYASKSRDFSLGPSLSFYRMPACGPTLCAQMAGVAAGGHARVNVYVTERFGWAISGTLEWLGSGRVLGGGAAAVVTGPVFRWSSQE